MHNMARNILEGLPTNRTIVVIKHKEPFTFFELLSDVDIVQQRKSLANPSFRFQHNELSVANNHSRVG